MYQYLVHFTGYHFIQMSCREVDWSLIRQEVSVQHGRAVNRSSHTNVYTLCRRHGPLSSEISQRVEGYGSPDYQDKHGNHVKGANAAC